MRLLSQDGRKEWDFPYEKVFISIDEINNENFCIVASLLREDKRKFIMAEYSVIEIAENVLADMRRSYVADVIYYRFPDDNEEIILSDW